MKNKIKSLSFAMLLCALSACNSFDAEPDMEFPEILPVGEVASPLNCQVYPLGGSIPFTYAFTDNVELGSYNIEIHNNFDHHAKHSNKTSGYVQEEMDCEQDPVKDPVNPWVFNEKYSIPSGKTVYEVSTQIPIPSDIDPGEYHFMIRVTDASGWQQLKAVTVFIR